MNIVFYQLYASYLWKALDQEAQTLQSEIWQKRRVSTEQMSRGKQLHGEAAGGRAGWKCPWKRPYLKKGGWEGLAHPQISHAPRKHRTLTTLSFATQPVCLIKTYFFTLVEKNGFGYLNCGYQFCFSGGMKKNAILSNALNSFHQTHICKDSAKWIISSL